MQRYNKLKKIIEKLGKVLIAYSGGADSTFLLKTAVDTLGRKNVLAVTARSSTYPTREYKAAAINAKNIGARHLAITSEELNIRRFAANPVNRCYYCKKELFLKLLKIANERGYKYIADGANYDDRLDMRFGSKAAAELGIRSPLKEARMTKEDIRSYSQKLGLATWDKPSFACLASRIPYGREITALGLQKIEKSESFIRGFGIRQVRVRAHGDIARIEVASKDIGKLIRPDAPEKITRRLKGYGFRYITLDMEGYRTGSMNPVKRFQVDKHT